MTVNATYYAGGTGYTPADMLQRDADWVIPGVISMNDLVVAQTGTPSMAVTVTGAAQGVTGGNAWLPNGYRVFNDSLATLTISAADTTNPRIDLVVIGIDTTTNPYTPQLKVIKGTAAASPTVPAYPTGFVGISLVKIAVAANATSITNSNITDLRVIAGMNTNALSDQLITTAGGTANAITIPMQPLVSGYRKTFIASANNSGSATTVNGLPLYKPGGTSAPTLISGKAYEIWYSSSGNCFFLKASASGSAIAAHVLATDTFSNDADTGLQGTMPNNGAETQATKIVPLTNVLTNGDFSNGTTGWATANTTVTASSNVAAVTATGSSSVEHFAEHDNVVPVPVVGHKYYVCATVTGVSGKAQIRAYNLQSSGSAWDSVSSSAVTTTSSVSCILTPSSIYSTPNLMIRLYALDSSGNNVYTQSGQNSTFKQIAVIDLTAAYGSGNEPTQAQMDALITAFGGAFTNTAMVYAIPSGGYLTTGTTGSTEVMSWSNRFTDRSLIGDDYWNSSYPALTFSKGGNVQYGTLGVNSPAPRLAICPPVGWYPGSGAAYVTAEASQVASAIGLDSSKMLNTLTASGVTGTIPQIGYANNPSSCGQWGNGDLAVYLATTGYYIAGAGGSEVRVPVAQIQAVTSGLTAANIVSGASIFGVAGSATVSSLGGKQYASGTTASNASGLVTISGLSFAPRTFVAYVQIGYGNAWWYIANTTISTSAAMCMNTSYTGRSCTFTSSGFTIQGYSTYNCQWMAWE
jgi:hypothetical protein